MKSSTWKLIDKITNWCFVLACAAIVTCVFSTAINRLHAKEKIKAASAHDCWESGFYSGTSRGMHGALLLIEHELSVGKARFYIDAGATNNPWIPRPCPSANAAWRYWTIHQSKLMT